eukprot:1163610-Pyramimonas_sp.AAC.1
MQRDGRTQVHATAGARRRPPLRASGARSAQTKHPWSEPREASEICMTSNSPWRISREACKHNQLQGPLK